MTIPDWAIVTAAAVGLALAMAWSMVSARTEPVGEALFTAALFLAALALGLGLPSLRPLIIVGATAFNVLFAFFLVWGLSSEGTTMGGIAALAALLAWIASVVGSAMLVRSDRPHVTAVVLLTALPVVAAALLLRDAASSPSPAGTSLKSSIWMLAMLLLPAVLAAYHYFTTRA